jgi:hypothetical protein
MHRLVETKSCMSGGSTEYLHTEVSLLRENRKVVFTKIAGALFLASALKRRTHPPGILNSIMF